MLVDIVSSISDDEDICMQGDFNASILAPNSNTFMLNKFVEHTALHIISNDLPTYFGPVATTTIDHFLLSPSLLPFLPHHYVQVSPSTITHPPSDHCAVSAHLYATDTRCNPTCCCISHWQASIQHPQLQRRCHCRRVYQCNYRCIHDTVGEQIRYNTSLINQYSATDIGKDDVAPTNNNPHSSSIHSGIHPTFHIS